MNLNQFKKYRGMNSDLSNGQVLCKFIRELLDNMELSLAQSLNLDNVIKGGNYSPSDSMLYKNILELLTVATADGADTLISYLKKLPELPEVAIGYKYLIDGSPATVTEWFGSEKAGVKTISYSTKSDEEFANKPFADMTEEEFRSSGVVGTRFGEELGRELFGNGFSESHTKKHIDFDEHIHIPTPVADAQMEATFYSDIGDEEASLSEEQEFEFNEASEPEIRRSRC